MCMCFSSFSSCGGQSVKYCLFYFLYVWIKVKEENEK